MRQAFPISILILLVSTGAAPCYDRFDAGCNDCHGSYLKKPYTSPRGEVWPTSLHELHRNKDYMGGAAERACELCHIQTGDNPDMNRSAVGPGCLNCHGRMYAGKAEGRGLRQHHRQAGASNCSGCHPSSETPHPEKVKPPAYGGTRTIVGDPCNLIREKREDWSGNGRGLDNDGDGLYDGADPDCKPANQPPRADFTFTPTKCSTVVRFADASTDPDAGDAIASWAWDFGDDGSVDSTLKDPSREFASAGTFSVRLTVKDASGAEGTAAKQVVIPANRAPAADFQASVAGADVRFTDLSADSDGTVESWSWAFGDGATSTAREPAHTYANFGTFPVTLTVSDDCGATGEKTLDIVVVSPPKGFTRGDCNSDAQLDIGDAIRILNYLFGQGAVLCLDACDSNDSGQHDIGDGIYLLNHLFAKGDPPPEPFIRCGVDPTDDPFGCQESSCR